MNRVEGGGEMSLLNRMSKWSQQYGSDQQDFWMEKLKFTLPGPNKSNLSQLVDPSDVLGRKNNSHVSYKKYFPSDLGENVSANAAKLLAGAFPNTSQIPVFAVYLTLAMAAGSAQDFLQEAGVPCAQHYANELATAHPLQP